ncbi:hypothetical protein SEA_WYBORN_51 [Arthrobacter phage Wyborn]|uniref:Uncharacterized protein n=1 Tax=Arthrobacter phage Wyborn TaxID=3059067 RepID=A0AA96H0X2_9CAUD|nr:hypothetical protein SEA_WYBORN_51 [Arthrobacter phage Wyborn]
MIRVVIRRSRKQRYCEEDFAHKRVIEPGQLYGRVSVSPRDALQTRDVWCSYPICFSCVSPAARLKHYCEDKIGRALVAAIHERKARALH